MNNTNYNTMTESAWAEHSGEFDPGVYSITNAWMYHVSGTNSVTNDLISRTTQNVTKNFRDLSLINDFLSRSYTFN